jgi:hypothetical protein
MITVEDIQNSEHRLCGFLDPLCVHLQHRGHFLEIIHKLVWSVAKTVMRYVESVM